MTEVEMPLSMNHASLETSMEEDPKDNELEQMLAEAERLANEMRNMSQKNLMGTSAFPDTIQIKDKDSVCSSMEITNTAGDLHPSEGDAASSITNNLKEEVIDEENEMCPTDPEVEIEAHQSTGSPDLSDLSSSRRASTSADVDAVIQASQEMARTLAEINAPVSSPGKETWFQDKQESQETTPQSASNGSTISPSPSAPSSLCDDSKTTVPVSHLTNGTPSKTNKVMESTTTKTFDNNVSWERVEYTSEKDEDYVPIADYSKESISVPTKKHKKEQIDKSGVKWEKLSPPGQGETDYTPLVDYSAANSKSSMKRKDDFQYTPDPIPTFGNLRRTTMRRLRKRQKRMKAAIALACLLVVVAVVWFKHDDLSDVWYQVRLATYGPNANEIAQAEAMAAKMAAEEAARHAQEKKAAAEAARIAAAEKAEADRLAAIQRAQEEEAARKAEEERQKEQEKASIAAQHSQAVEEFQKLCGNPLATLVSPVCREKRREIDRIPAMQELLRIVTSSK